MTRWEYRLEELRLSDKWSSKKQAAELEQFKQAFNAIGAEGWELVNYQAVPLTGSIDVTNIKGYAYLAIFKRPSA